MSPNDKTIEKKSGDAPVRALVPMMHVADVERSVEFYRLLGFEIGNRQPQEGRMQWAWLCAPKVSEWRRRPNLMVARGERPGAPEAQDVLFYVYATDLVSLRNELMARGLKVGEIKHPFYLPQGEFRMRGTPMDMF